VVIPSYNKVKYIGATLGSIVSQNYPNLEVIIQDGRSNDGTLEIIKNYIMKYPKIFSYESKDDKGKLDAINKGLKKTSGEIVTYINADDVYSQGTFLNVAEAFIKRPEALWFAGKGVIINREGDEIAKLVTIYKNFLLFQNSRFYLLVTNYLMQPSVFLTRKAFDGFGPFAGTTDFVTEYDLWLKLSNVEMPVVIDSALSKFRIEPATKTKQITSKLLIADEKIVRCYTMNPIILVLHKLNNFGRILTGKMI